MINKQVKETKKKEAFGLPSVSVDPPTDPFLQPVGFGLLSFLKFGPACPAPGAIHTATASQLPRKVPAILLRHPWGFLSLYLIIN